MDLGVSVVLKVSVVVEVSVVLEVTVALRGRQDRRVRSTTRGSWPA